MTVYVNEELVEQGEYWETASDSSRRLNDKGVYLETRINEVSLRELVLQSGMVSLTAALITCLLCDLVL